MEKGNLKEICLTRGRDKGTVLLCLTRGRFFCHLKQGDKGTVLLSPQISVRNRHPCCSSYFHRVTRGRFFCHLKLASEIAILAVPPIFIGGCDRGSAAKSY